MKTYQYLEKPYVSPINLDVLNTTFSNLETMHQKAVQTGSELKAAIAKLPLNEAEEGFRDNLYAQIQQTIDQNTIHGNLAAGYDDLVKYQGELLTNKALVGRINAQAEYLKHKEYIDKFDISESGKEMYRAMNPYYYEDKIDENGNIIGGSIWRPNSSPTKVVDLNSLIIKGLNLAAKEKGYSYVTQWLDKDGKPTTDPSKAFDGNIYNEITRQYERLGHDKIKKAIYSVIENDPNAKDSLLQDYMIAKWEYSKNPNNLFENNPLITENGNIRSFEEYISYRLDPAAEVASYNYINEQTQYGPGFASYKKAQRDALETAIKTEQKRREEEQKKEFLSNFNLGARGSNIKIVTDFDSVYKNMNTMFLEIKNELKRIGISDEDLNKLNNTYTTLNSFIDNIERTPENISSLQTIDLLLRNYKYYEAGFNSKITQLNETDSELYLLKNKLSINKNFSSKGGELERDILNNISILEFETFKGDFDKLYNISLQQLKGSYEFYKEKYKNNSNFIFNDETYDISLDYNHASTKDKLEFMKLLKIKYDNSYINNIVNDYNLINNFNTDEKELSFETLASIELLPFETFGQNVAYKGYLDGTISKDEYTSLVSNYNKDIKNKILSTDFSQHLLYKGINGATLELVNISDILKESNIIREAINNNNYSINPAYSPTIKDPLTNTLGGYYITIFPQKQTTTQTKDGEKELVELVGDENTYTYYIPSIGLEDTRDILMSDINVQLNNFYQIIGDTKETYNIYDTYDMDSSIGDIKITGIDDSTFKMSFFGEEFITDKSTVIELTKQCELISNIKHNLAVKNISIDEYFEEFYTTEGEEKFNYLRDTIQSLCDNISRITGQSIKDVSTLIEAELYNLPNNNDYVKETYDKIFFDIHD